MRIVVLAALLAAVSSSAFAQTRVDGYTRQNGTYVAPHYRSAPDGNANNNWSVQPNVNPYTGQQGTHQPQPYGYGSNSGSNNLYNSLGTQRR